MLIFFLRVSKYYFLAKAVTSQSHVIKLNCAQHPVLIFCLILARDRSCHLVILLSAICTTCRVSLFHPVSIHCLIKYLFEQLTLWK